jgi:hypothetical protein
MKTDIPPEFSSIEVTEQGEDRISARGLSSEVALSANWEGDGNAFTVRLRSDYPLGPLDFKITGQWELNEFTEFMALVHEKAAEYWKTTDLLRRSGQRL